MNSSTKFISTIGLTLTTLTLVNCSVKWADKLTDKGFDKYCIGEHKKAIRLYNRAILFNKKSVLAYWRRADIYYKADKYEKSIQDLNKAISIDSSFQMGDLFGSRADSKLMLNDYDGALKDISQGIRIGVAQANEPNTPQRLFYTRSLIYLLKKDTTASLHDLDTAIFYWGAYPSALWLRAKLLTIKGRYELAIKDYNRMPFSQADAEFDYNAENFFYSGLSKFKTGDTSFCSDWKISEKYNFKLASDYIKKYCSK